MPDNTQGTGISRRSFIGGAGIVAAGAAVMGLAGCAPQSNAGSGASSAKAGAATANRWQSEAAAAWRTAPEPVDEASISDGGTYDLVIVGGGQSGTWTAKSAAKNGLKAIVIESQTAEDHMFVGGEVGTINNPWALEHGAREIDPQEFMREVFRRNQGRSNQRLIKDYVDHSGALLQEVIDELGEDWMAEHTHVGSCPPDDRIVLDPSDYKYFLGTVIFRDPAMQLSEWSWAEVMNKQVEVAQAAGAEWAYNHHAEYLEKDDAGRVTAVIVKDKSDESYKRFTAEKGVILAGGDFAGNVDMLRDINDEYRHLAESLGNIELAASAPMFLERDGSGIAMGVWAGGHVEVGPRAGMNTGQAGPEAPWGPGSLMLNQNGLRFCDECAGGTEGSAYMVPRQPVGSVVAINDANWQDIVYTMPPCHGAVDYRREIGWPETVSGMEAVVPGTEPSPVQLPSATAKVYCAETVEELVRIVGVWDDDQQKAAIEEIKRYQGFAAAGKDEDFAKDPRILAVTRCDTPPFYAVVGDSTAMNPGLCQTAGLDIDAEHHVLDSSLQPIPGLFSVGNNAGNRFIVQYATPLAGMSLGFCLTEGTLLAERIAKGEIA
ncbi:FAD-dependent oxidoreductase [Gordonibacter sp. An230]|uniref:FAD-dependent oxidoreductase n=1 Tax=Gordonibacter sp. An230 TaxID=1965592 RepID=UPI0013A63251|nr:FAD-dependent oxidoreductase [Gordonibacter sp. An230]